MNCSYDQQHESEIAETLNSLVSPLNVDDKQGNNKRTMLYKATLRRVRVAIVVVEDTFLGRSRHQRPNINVCI
jgi:ABC-type cobalamin transport system ATPase subunit